MSGWLEPIPFFPIADDVRCILAVRQSFLLRIDPEILEAVRHWADDDLRSVNAQVEFLLRRALSESGRLPKPSRSQERKGKSKKGRGGSANG
jgi:hypothetical protein